MIKEKIIIYKHKPNFFRILISSWLLVDIGVVISVLLVIVVIIL